MSRSVLPVLIALGAVAPGAAAQPPGVERFPITVLEPDGTPSRFAQVHYRCGGASTSPEGTFTLVADPCRPVYNRASAAETVDLTLLVRNGGREATWHGAWPTAAPLVIHLHPARSISGKVVDDRGAPVKAFALEVSCPRPLPSDDKPTTFSGGHFTLPDVPAPPVSIIATTPDGRVGSADAPTSSAITITVAPGARIRGRLVDATTGKPVTTATVWRDGRHPVKATDDGRFDLAPLLPGVYRLGVVATPYTQWRREIPVARGEVVDLGDVPLAPTTDRCQYRACDVIINGHSAADDP